jgi:hypothetical protein
MKGVSRLRLLVVPLCAALSGCGLMPSGKQDTLSLLAAVTEELEIAQFDKFSITINGVCFGAGELMLNFMARNTNVIFEDTQLRIATAGDAMSDYKKRKYGFDYKKISTPNDGYADSLILLAGIKKEDRSNIRPICTTPFIDAFGFPRQIPDNTDTDGDGFSDCEEQFLGTNYQNKYNDWDTDNDTISDYLAVLYGMSPKDGNQALRKFFGDDKYTNKQKVQMNLPINVKVEGVAAAAAYSYASKPTPELGFGCKSVTASNIPLSIASSINKIKVYFTVQQGVDEQSRPLVVYLTYTIPVPSTIPNGENLEFNYVDLQQ